MKQLVFYDHEYWEEFLPLTFTRPIADIRVGILTFKERWEKLLGYKESFFITENYLQKKYPSPPKEDILLIVPNFLPTPNILQKIKDLRKGDALIYQNKIIASYIYLDNFINIEKIKINKYINITEELLFFKKPWDLFTYNDKAIRFDFNLMTEGRTSQEISKTNKIRGKVDNIFLEKGANVEFSFLNTIEGPIYIGKNAEIMEGVMLRGPIAICDNAIMKMGAKVFGGTTFGPYTKICGEVSNTIIFGYSSKAHDGYLGNSVLGEWCNLGADTNTSNLKNNYSSIKMWSYREKKFIETGLQFCGTIMGDHSKTSINTQMNTGSVVGVAANIFKTGFPPNLVNVFSWGGGNNDPKFLLNKAYETAEIMMARRKVKLTEEDKEILKYIYYNF